MPSADLTVFVTVGSTSFDGLVDCLTAPQALDVLHAAGVRRLLVQFGRGAHPAHRSYTPSASPNSTPLVVEALAFAPSLTPHLAAADVVATHCGAGCVFEALAARRHVVAVPNRRLMDDHQGELANELDAIGALRVAEVGDDVARVVALACRDVRMGVEAPGDDGCPRNSTAFAGIVAEEVRPAR
jgi:UDP-N-acetylglucosamine transferase subunit ALG13